MNNNYEYFQHKYNRNSIQDLNDYIEFCKLETRLRIEEDKLKGKRDEEIRRKISYYDRDDFRNLKHSKFQNVASYYLRKEGFNKLINKDVNTAGLIKIDGKTTTEYKSRSGILKKENLKELISNHLPGSFVIQGKFTLESPYYSADDEPYYILDNPVMKDKVFKVPMMRGSSWKGVLSTAIRSIMKKNKDNLLENYLSFVRLFGAGSEEFRKMIDLVSKKEINNDDFQKQLKWYALTKLGKTLDLTDNNLDKKIWDEIKQKSLQVQRGRLIFYPSYFDKLSLEMINPHKRRTKAGTQPVYYEVVPKGASGIFQLLYIPADGITKSKNDLQEEVINDLKLLTIALKRIFQENGDDVQVKIGAKTKLGWGRVKADQFDFIKRKEDSLNSSDSSFLKLYTGGVK